MNPIDYRWWVPQTGTPSRRPPLLRAFTDLEYVNPWLYAVIPAVMLTAMVFAPGLRHGPGLEAALITSGAWVVATRARFALAQNVTARRNHRRPAPLPIPHDDYPAAA